MMTSIIVDDELNNIEVLQQYLQEHLPEVQVLAHAQSVDEAKKTDTKSSARSPFSGYSNAEQKWI